MKPFSRIDLSPANTAARRDADLLAIEDYIDRKGYPGSSWADEYLALLDLYKDFPAVQELLKSAQLLNVSQSIPQLCHPR